MAFIFLQIFDLELVIRLSGKINLEVQQCGSIQHVWSSEINQRVVRGDLLESELQSSMCVISGYRRIAQWLRRRVIRQCKPWPKRDPVFVTSWFISWQRVVKNAYGVSGYRFDLNAHIKRDCEQR